MLGPAGLLHIYIAREHNRSQTWTAASERWYAKFSATTFMMLIVQIPATFGTTLIYKHAPMLIGTLPGNGSVDGRTAMTVQRLKEADFPPDLSKSINSEKKSRCGCVPRPLWSRNRRTAHSTTAGGRVISLGLNDTIYRFT